MLLWILVAATALAAAIGLAPGARGYLIGSVSNPASLVRDDANPLIRCDQPFELSVLPGTAISGPYFECTDNYNAPVTLIWSIVAVDPPTGTLTVSGSDTLAAGEVAACKQMTLAADLLSPPGTYTVTYRGSTAATGDFFASVSWTGRITVGLLPLNPASCKG